MFGQSDNSAFDTLDHDKHRMRREPWNPYFSKQSVSRIQPLLIQPLVSKLCERLAEHQAAGKPVVMTHAYSCLTLDIISEYSFPKGYGLLDRAEFDSDNYQAWMSMSKMSHTLKQFGWLYPLLRSMPLWVTKYTSPETHLVLQQSEHLYQQTLAIHRQRDKLEYKKLTTRSSMLAAFLDSDLPPAEKSAHRIAGEAQGAIAAGTLTSTHALKHATYHILANPPIFERLMEDLQRVIPDHQSAPSLRELEQIPYLVAILYETLRMFHGVSHRLQRICPDQSLQYGDWTIPPGTPVGMTSVHTHNDPSIFPDPHAFKPERWLPLQTEGQRLQKYLMAFGKGSRQCVGMELGKAEILTTLATVFRRFGRQMRLYETTREKDIDLVHDVFNPMASRRSNGLMILFDKPLDPA